MKQVGRLVATVIALLCGALRTAGAATITLGAPVDISPTTFALPIGISDGVQVTSWEFGLAYDPTDVQVNTACDPFGDAYCSLITGAVTEGDFFASGAPFNLLLPGFVVLDAALAQSGLLLAVHVCPRIESAGEQLRGREVRAVGSVMRRPTPLRPRPRSSWVDQ
jgi:hypothetical protein